MDTIIEGGIILNKSNLFEKKNVCLSCVVL